MNIASTAAALFSLVLGVLGFVWPQVALSLVGLKLNPDLPHSVSEVRATYGGIFMGMSLYALVSGQPQAFLALASAWVMAGLCRSVSAVLDRAFTGGNLMGIVVELLTGALIALPYLHFEG